MNGSAKSNGHGHTDAGIKRRRPVTAAGSRSLSDKAKTLSKPRDFCTRWEVPRKVLHGSIGFVTLGLYLLRPPRVDVIILPLCGALTIVAAADAIRLKNSAFERLYERLLGPLMRDSEKSSINGVVWYLIGVIFVLALYPRDVAVEAILLLSWADTAASTFGRLYGHLTPRLPSHLLGLPIATRKSLAGVIGSFATTAFTTLVFWGFCTRGMGAGLGDAVWQWSQPRTGGWPGIVLLSIGAGIVTSIAEVLDLGSMDDNLTLPIISGALVWAIAYALHIVSLIP